MDKKLHLLESFSAQGRDGTSYKVCAYEHMAPDLSVNDGNEHWLPTGVAEYRLASGERVDMGHDGTMRIVDSGVELTRP